VKKPKVEEASSGEGVACCVEYTAIIYATVNYFVAFVLMICHQVSQNITCASLVVAQCLSYCIVYDAK